MGGGGILIDVLLTHSGRAILRYVNSFNSWCGGKCMANITILTWFKSWGGGSDRAISLFELNLPLSLGRGGGHRFFLFCNLGSFFATFEKCCKNHTFETFLLQTQCYKVLRKKRACCTAKCCKLFEQRFYKRNTATLVIYSGK